MRLMVVGTGFGEIHLNWLAACPAVKVDYLAYANNRGRAEKSAADHGVANVTDDPMSVIADRSVDGVVVVTPPACHEPLALAALGAGLLVVTDKPLAESVAAAERMTAAADGNGFVTFQWRFHPAFQTLRHLVLSGELGDIVDIDLQFHHDFLAGPSTAWPWRHLITDAGAGTLGDQGVHLFDLLRFTAPGDWRVDWADLTVVWPERSGDDGMVVGQTEDVASVQMTDHHTAGRSARVFTSRVSVGHRSLRVSVVGTGGTGIAEVNPDDGSGSLRTNTSTTTSWAVTDYAGVSVNPYASWLGSASSSAAAAHAATFADGLAAQRMMHEAAEFAR